MKSLFAEKEPREKRSFRSRLDAKREKRKRSLEKEREERTEERENAFLFGTEDGEEEEWSLFGRSKESGLKPFDLFSSNGSPDEPSYSSPMPHLRPTPPCDEEEAMNWSIGSLFDEGEEVEEEEDVYTPIKKPAAPTIESSSMTHTSRVATTTTSASISITTTTIASTVSQPIAGGNSEEVALRKKVAELERLLSEKEKKISWYVFKHQYL